MLAGFRYSDQRPVKAKNQSSISGQNRIGHRMNHSMEYLLDLCKVVLYSVFSDGMGRDAALLTHAGRSRGRIA